MTTPDKGAAVTLLIPSTSYLVDGSTVTINTSYPFEDSVTITCKANVGAFPLYIRIPSWATKARLDGQPVVPGTFEKRLCTPTSSAAETARGAGGHHFVLELSPEITIEQWATDQYGGAAPHPGYSVVRGPLLYSLPIAHNFTIYGRHFGSGNEASNDYFLQPTVAWNYALDIPDLAHTANALKFVPGEAYRTGAAPFNRTGPFRIEASARLLPSWSLLNNSAAPPPQSPACKGAFAGESNGCGPKTTLTLVPHGYTELRIGEFPLA
eukprot:COSAG06_NODE_4253_length_4428_cov_56.290829_3_plen_267_part_00